MRLPQGFYAHEFKLTPLQIATYVVYLDLFEHDQPVTPEYMADLMGVPCEAVKSALAGISNLRLDIPAHTPIMRLLPSVTERLERLQAFRAHMEKHSRETVKKSLSKPKRTKKTNATALLGYFTRLYESQFGTYACDSQKMMKTYIRRVFAHLGEDYPLSTAVLDLAITDWEGVKARYGAKGDKPTLRVISSKYLLEMLRLEHQGLGGTVKNRAGKEERYEHEQW